jgi:hypothetical protein
MPLRIVFLRCDRNQESEQTIAMSDALPRIQVGDTVPDFKLTTFEPSTGGFGEFDLAKKKVDGRWTILFFYPADFTFV